MYADNFYNVFTTEMAALNSSSYNSLHDLISTLNKIIKPVSERIDNETSEEFISKDNYIKGDFIRNDFIKKIDDAIKKYNTERDVVYEFKKLNIL